MTEEFFSLTNHGYFHSWCKKCRSKYNARKYEEKIRKNPGWWKKVLGIRYIKAKLFRKQNPLYWKSKALRKYGLTLEEYGVMLEKQNRLCAVCLLPPRGKLKNRRLAVDHNHKTGVVRGLVCFQCNRAIGLLGDSASIATRLARYLEKKDL